MDSVTRQHLFKEKENIDKIIKLYQDGNSANKIATIFGCSSGGIYGVLKRSKIKIRKPSICHSKFKKSPKDINKAIELYENGTSASKICELFKCSIDTLKSVLKENNVKIRNLQEVLCTRINENYFQNIDSHNKAQILGMIGADGCVCRNKLYLALQEKDFEYLEWIKKETEFDGKISFIKKQEENYQNSYLIRVGNKKIIHDLNKLGIVPRKSLILDFPSFSQVPEEFINSYILGYFEGDGCIHVSKKNNCHIDFCGTYSFCLKLKNYLESILDIHFSLIKSDKIYRTKMEGNKQCLKLLNWMYKNSSFQMKRKHEIYLKLKNEFQDKYNLGITGLCGEQLFQSKLKAEQVLEIREKRLQNFSRKDLAKFYNISEHTIYDIETFRRWKFLTPETIKFYQKQTKNYA